MRIAVVGDGTARSLVQTSPALAPQFTPSRGIHISIPLYCYVYLNLAGSKVILSFFNDLDSSAFMVIDTARPACLDQPRPGTTVYSIKRYLHIYTI